MEPVKRKIPGPIRIISLIVVIAFTFNQLAYGLSPWVGSPQVYKRMLEKGINCQAAEGPGFREELERRFSTAWVGGEPELPLGVRFIEPDYEHLPSDWSAKEELYQNTTLVGALNFSKEEIAEAIALKFHGSKDKALVSKISSQLTIKEAYYEIESDKSDFVEAKGEIPEGRLELTKVDGKDKWTLIVETRLAQMWAHKRKNDTWLKWQDWRSEDVTSSAAFGIFEWIKRHYLSGIKNGEFRNTGHITLTLNDLPNISEDEMLANTIDGRRFLANYAIKLWFIASYAFGNSTRYNNDLFRDRCRWILTNPQAETLGIRQQFPEGLEGGQIDSIISIACGINYDSFGRRNIGFPELKKLKISDELKDEYEARKTKIEKTIYAGGAASDAENSIIFLGNIRAAGFGVKVNFDVSKNELFLEIIENQKPDKNEWKAIRNAAMAWYEKTPSAQTKVREAQEAVGLMLDGEITESIPASGLRQKNVLPNVRIYLDKPAASKSKVAELARLVAEVKHSSLDTPAEVIGEASGEADFLESQRGILPKDAVHSSAQDTTGSSVVGEGLRRLAPDHTLADGHEQVIPEAGDGTAAGLGESTDVAEATGAIAFIQDAEGVLGTEGRAEEWQIFNWTGSAFHRICGDIEKSRGDDAIKIEKIGVIPRGKSKFPIIAYVDPSAKKRIVGISEEFLEDMAGLCRLVNNRNESVSGAQLAIIRYIIEAAVLHEVGHGFEGYSGMDIHTLTKTPQVRNDFAELLGIQDAASMDSDKLVEAIADLNIGGKGNADYARNKAAYLFYKFLMHDPVMYVTSNGDVDTRSVTSAVDGYFSSNPLMAVMHEAETAGMVCGQAALFCGQFFGKGSRWRNENRLSQKSVPQERPQVLTKAQEAEKEREAQLRTKITSLVRQSASRSLGNAERARIRSSLARSENAAVALEIAEGMAESANRGSAEQRMLKATAREIKNVMGLHGGSAAGLGMGEESPEVLDFFKSITAKGYAPVRMSQRIGDTLYYIDSAKGKVVTVDLNGDLEAIKDTFIYLHAICLKEHPEFMTIVEKQSQDVARVYLRGSQLYRENPDFIALLEENGVLPAIEKTEKRNASMVSSVLAGHKAVVDTKGNIMSFGKNMREAYYRNRIIISSSKMQNVAHDMGKVEHLALEKMAALTDVEKHRQALLAGGKGETKIDTIKISGEEITKYEGQIAEIRRHLHIAGLEIASRGLVDGPGGNISSCTSDRRFMVIKASGKAFETMSPEEYVVVDIASGDVVEGFGEVLKPSVETFFHLAIYKTRDDVSSVVHTHPIYGTAVATSGYSIVVPGGQNIGRLPYVNPGRPELADAVRPVVKDADIVLIANHGAITVGKDIYAALRLTEELEYTAETAAKVLRTKVEQIDAETLVEDLLKAAYPVMTQRDITMQTRIKTALNYRGIDIIDELLGCSREDILKLRNMGNDVMSYLEGALSEFGLRLNTKPEKINIMTKLLETGKKRVSRIVEGITRHMNKGLRGDKDTSIAMYPSYATIPTGMETGEYLALDVGGTNLRVLRVRLEGNGKYTIVDKTESIAIPNSLKKRDPGTGRLPKAEELFDFIANAVKDFAAKQDFGTNTKIPMGFTWSFPVEQTGVASGIHKNWGKEWETEGVKGKDVVDLLNAALGLKAVNNVKVAALCNDTGGTFAVGRYLNPNCIMGVILGTGTNGAFYLPLSEIIKFKDNFASEDMVINTEWCNYTIPYRSIWDGVLDRESGNEKRHLLEKMVSGGYIGEVTRIILKDLISKKMLFAGQSSSAFDLKHDEEDDEKGIPGWYARHLDRIELDDSQELSDIQKLLEGLGIQNSTPEDRRIVREITTAVVMRSARVSAAAIASIIKRMNIDLAKEHTVAIDGSLFEYSPHFKERMEKLLIEEFGENAKNIKLTFTEDGSGVGAAIMAAVAEKHSLEKEGLAKSEKCTAKVKTAVDNLRTGKDVPTQTMILERTMTCPCSVPEAREIAQEALMERAREVSSFVENEFKEERSVVRKIIAEWVIKTGANIGPGAKAEIGAAMKKEEIVDLWKIVNLVHETKIQHIIAKPVAPKGVAKEALDELSKKLSTDNKEGDVEPGYFTSAKELESLLKPEKGVKKIVITTDDTTIQNAVNEVRASDPGLFRDVRLYPVSLPKTFRDKDQEAVYHAQMLFEATLVRLLDGENTQFIEALLETMFENRIYEGDSCVNPKTSYIDINKNTENETIAAAKKRVGDTMKLTVRLTELVERSLRFLRLFWASA